MVCNMLEKRISDKIRQVRTTRGITLAKIAQGLGVPISFFFDEHVGERKSHEEFLFVLKGRIELVYGKESDRLNESDAIHFDPSIPHRAQNVGKEESGCPVIVIDKWSQ